jgi:hypothetical protein
VARLEPVNLARINIGNFSKSAEKVPASLARVSRYSSVVSAATFSATAVVMSWLMEIFSFFASFGLRRAATREAAA